MASNIPVIVQGNSFSLAIPLQIYYINGDQMDLQDYTPDPTDDVTVQLKGSRRNYTYTPTIYGNVANIDLSGNELADNYSVVVSIVKDNGQRLRSFRTDQFFIVESSDDLTTDDIIQGLEENVIYLNSSIFVAGEDGRGIESIVKTSTSGLVDTYTITYTDNTTSTFDVTNGAPGPQGPKGDSGVDLGEVALVNNLTEGGEESALTAEQGKMLGQAMSLVVDILKSGVYTADKSAEIEELENMFDNYVDVTKSLTNVSVSPDASTAAKGTSLTLTFTPSASHVIDAVTVTMGGVSQSVTIAQDQKSATCAIASVSGDIAITATASYVEQDLIDSATKLTGKGMTTSSYGNLVTDASYDCYIVPLDFGKWYHLTGYDWKDKGGTATAFNMALVTSDGNDGYTNIKSTALTSSIFTNNNAIFTIGSTNSNMFFNTNNSQTQSSILFATPTSAELTGVSDIYLAVNTRYSTVDISSDMSIKHYTPKALYDADDVIKYLGAIYPTYNLTGRSTDYDCVIFKADKGATYSYTGMDWQSKSGNGVAFVVGLLKNVGNLFDNLKKSDFVSGASWLSQDTFFTKTSNIVKASPSANGTFTIPEDTDLTDDVELYVIMNTRFFSVSVTADISTTKE